MPNENEEEQSQVAVVENENKPIQQNKVVFGLFPTKDQIKEYQDFLENYDAFIDSQLKNDIDFGIIPGVKKPSLLKPGAEKLEKLMFLTHKKDCVDKTEEKGYVSYTYRTTIYDRNGNIKSTCEGTCNSKEKKYRYTTVYENKATEEQKQKGVLEERNSKNGGRFKVYVIERDDAFDIQNTIMKMAQKRSYVGAILEATNSSGRFTQDVEDDATINIPKQSTQPQAEATATVTADLASEKQIALIFSLAKQKLGSQSKDEAALDIGMAMASEVPEFKTLTKKKASMIIEFLTTYVEGQ